MLTYKEWLKDIIYDDWWFLPAGLNKGKLTTVTSLKTIAPNNGTKTYDLWFKPDKTVKNITLDSIVQHDKDFKF